MASPTAASTDRFEEHDGDITYIRTDKDLPPVAIIDRSPITTRHKIIFGIIALLGAVAWAIIAFFRGETVNAVWFVIAAVCTYVIGFRFYARLIEMKIVQPARRQRHARRALRERHGLHADRPAGAVRPPLRRDRRRGPAGRPGAGHADGLPARHHLDHHRRRVRRLRPGLPGAVDLHSRGAAAPWARWPATNSASIGGVAAIVGVLVIMVILLAVLALVVVNALAESPWGVFSIAMTIPIALFMGLYLRFLRPGRVSEVSLIGVVLLLLAVVSGGWVAETAWGADWFTLSKVTLSWCIIIYGFAASVLPVWLLLAPRDYLSTFMKVGTIVLLALGILLARPIMEAPAVSSFASSGTGPVFAGSLFPFLFITIACGALSGFHALISSGTTPKLLEKESQMRLIGYGGMLTESFVAIMALITAAILNQHLYFAMNAPAASDRRHRGDRGRLRQRPRAVRRADHRRSEITQAAEDVGEESIVSRTGGAPTLAFGMSEVLHQVFGGESLKAFWYHFAIMFEALFILTTVDAGTRVARFMLSDGLGNLGGPLQQAAGSELAGRRLDLQRDRGRGLGQHPADGRHRPARRHQHPVPAVRHRQPAAGRHRADGRDRRGDQEGPAEMGVDSRRFRCCGT